MLIRRQLRDRLSTLYWSGVGMLSAGIISLQPVYADNIFERIQSIVYDIYGQSALSSPGSSSTPSASWLRTCSLSWPADSM